MDLSPYAAAGLGERDRETVWTSGLVRQAGYERSVSNGEK